MEKERIETKGMHAALRVQISMEKSRNAWMRRMEPFITGKNLNPLSAKKQNQPANKL